MKQLLLSAVLLALSFLSNAQTLIMNEVSQGVTGNMEYVEFIVVDTTVSYDCVSGIPPSIDIRGWIFDDNSGYHGASGIASGCVRFSFDPLWSAVPLGTIILIYNDAQPEPTIPADDISMADGNCLIVAPISDVNLFESNATTPGAIACSYPAAGWTPGGNWSNTLLANGGDCARIVDLAGCEVFSVCWGTANANTQIYFSGSATNTVYWFNDIDPEDQANWSSGCTDDETILDGTQCGSNEQTPGAPNNAANAAYIAQFNNGCTPIPPMAASASVDNDEMCSCDGQATASGAGSIGPYTYEWFDDAYTPIGQTTATATNLCPGTYHVIITSSIGCPDTATIIIAPASTLSIDAITPTDPSCNGDCDGEITVSVSGGTPPYSYQWYDASMNPIGPDAATITGLCAGDYNVEVTDASGGAVQLYYEDFESGAGGWTLNVSLGGEGSDPNFFVINDDEGGVAPPGCGVAWNGDATLHVTSVFNPGGGAAYDAGGLCGFLFCPETHRQSESPNISTVGQSGLTLNFDFIANGDIPNDQATVWYNDGSGWTQLGGPLFSGTGVCAPQGIWTAYSSALPASCENIPNLQIAIRWDNNDDAFGSDPSVAINNIEIVAAAASPCPVIASTTLADPAPVVVTASVSNPVCFGSSFTVTETGGDATSWTWSSDGSATITNTTDQTPTITGAVDGETFTVIGDYNGCTASDAVAIIMDNPPTASNPTPISVECAADVPAPDPAVVTDEADDFTIPPTVTWISDATDGSSCPETITRTYRVEDACGNFVDVTQTITILPVTPPVVPADGSSTVVCVADAQVQPASPAVTDVCGNTITPTVTAPSAVACEGDMAWVFTYTDCAGNSTDWTYTYTVDYAGALTPPVAGASTVSCPADAVDPGAPADILDACGNTVSAVFVSADPLPACEGTVVYTYRYTACDGTTTADWTYTYTIDYSGALTPPAAGASTVSCPADAVDPGAPADITDACGNPVSAVFVSADPLPACEGTVVYTYRYTACDGVTTADWTYTYTIDYTGGLTPPAAGASTVSCPADAVDPGAPADITDACGRTVSAVFVSADPLPACEGTVVYTYRYTACDGTTTADWTYTYTIDYTGGLTAPAAGASTVNCPADAVDPGAPADILDACGRTVSAVLVGSTAPPACEGTVVWTYQYTACDGTTTADWTYTYTISLPAFTIPYADGASTVNCPADAVDPGAPGVVTDQCGNTLTPVVTAPSAVACTGGTMDWVYTYTDCAGNTADWTYSYTVNLTPFVIPFADDASTVNCLSDAQVQPTPPGAVTDNCGNVITPTVTTPADIVCEGDMAWIFTYTDCAGNTADWTYTYTVDYTGALTAPANGSSTVSCPADAVDPGAPADITDACGNPVSAVFVSADPLPACEGTVVYTYRYTSCDGVTTADWTYTYTIDYTGGLTAPAAGASTVSCPADAVDPGAPVDILDACGRTVSAVLVGSDPLPACEGTVVWTYQYTACDGTTTADWTYTYTIDIPAFTLPANSSEAVQCMGDVYVPTAPAGITDQCGNALIPVMTENADPVCIGDKIYTFTYTDCAGNTADWTYTFNVNDDTAPTASNPATVTLAVGPAPAPDPNVVTDESDNCDPSPVVAWVSDVSDNGTCPETITRTYSVTDACGNQTLVTQTFIIGDNLPVAAASNDSPVCDDGTAINLTETGGDAVSWSWSSNGSATITNTTDQSPVVTGAADGEVFTVMITDIAGCTATAQTTVVVNALPTVSATNSGPICADVASFTVSETGGQATGWSWTSNGSATITNTTDQTPTVTGAADGEIFTVTGTDASGCQSTAQTTITINPLPTYTLTPTDPTTCNGTDGSILIDGVVASTDYEVTYFDGATTVGPTTMTSDGSGQITLSGLGAATYDVTLSVTATGCTGATVQTSLNNPGAPVIDPIAPYTSCAVDYVLPAITGSNLTGSETYYDAPGGPSGGGANYAAGTTISSTITLYAYDENGVCNDEEILVITINTLPTVSATNGGPICADVASFTVSETGGQATGWSWTSNGTATITSATDQTPTITGAADGEIFTVTGTDANGCQSTAQTTITINPLPTYTLTPTDPTTCNGTDGSILIDGVVASTDYEVTYFDGATTVGPTTMTSDGSGQITLSGLGAATYDVTLSVTATGCTGATVQTSLNNPGAPVLDPIADVDMCDVYNLPAITGTGLTGNESYWSGTGGTGTQYNVGDPITSTMTMYVYDINGACSDEESFLITVNPTPILDPIADVTACESYSLTAITGTNLSGNESYYNDTQANGGNPIAIGPLTSSQVVYVYDANGTCSDEISFNVVINALPTVTNVSGGGTYCQGDAVADIMVDVTGTANWTVDYTLDGTPMSVTGASTPISLGNAAGVYVVTNITDANCTNTASGTQTITINPIPAAPLVELDTTYCSSEEYANMVATGSGGTLTWFDDAALTSVMGTGTTMFPHDFTGATTYYVTETLNGCEGPAGMVTITINDCDITVPTAITPNNDGLNDDWEILDLDNVYPDNTIRIYNRWGNLLYSHDSSTDGPYDQNRWDGTYNGNALPVGSYYFIIEFNDKDNGTMSGAVSIILE